MNDLRISTDPEALADGSPEERACFGAVGIRYGSSWLTETYDEFINRVRSAPMISAYHLAEWMAWNWWRLRWEPRSNAVDWAFAHNLASIGEGYVWPNISIFSDGERVALISRATPERTNTRFRYLSDEAAVVSAIEFEYATEQFIEQTRGLLRERGIADSNLDRIWRDIGLERAEPSIARRRKLEALLGKGPDQNDEGLVDALLSDDGILGIRPVDEIAAEFPYSQQLLTATIIESLAARSGFDSSSDHVVRLSSTNVPRVGEVAAWRVGAEAAITLRVQEGIGDGPLRNEYLAELAAVSTSTLTTLTGGSDISFALDTGHGTARVVLRSKWETGRRFDLARLLGDRVVAAADDEKLLPATRAYTYRQKVQRSFAAELLSPYQEIFDLMAGDYSPENQEQIANFFQVSPLTIRTSLVNHRLLSRDDLSEFDFAA